MLISSRASIPGVMHKRKSPAGLHLKLITVVCLTVLAACSSPPVQEMSDARQAIKAAEGANAAVHAPERLTKARLHLKEAELKLQKKAYNSAKNDAIQAKNQALEALRTSAEANSEE